MQMTVSLLVGLVLGGAVLLFVTRKNGAVAAWIALVLGAIGTVLLIGIMTGRIWPEAGALHAIGVGLLSGVATMLAAGALLRGERKPLNWIALAAAAPPVLFLIVFGVGELLFPH